MILVSLVSSSLNAAYAQLYGEQTSMLDRRSQYRGATTPLPREVTQKPQPLILVINSEWLNVQVSAALEPVFSDQQINGKRQYKHKWDGLEETPYDFDDARPKCSLKGNVQGGTFKIDVPKDNTTQGFVKVVLPLKTFFERKKVADQEQMLFAMRSDDFITACEEGNLGKIYKAFCALTNFSAKRVALKVGIIFGSVKLAKHVLKERKKGRSLGQQAKDAKKRVSSFFQRMRRKEEYHNKWYTI